MRQDARPAPLRWVLARPALLALGGYVVLAAIFFWPGLLSGHTVSAADYLWNSAPWNTSVPAGVPVHSLHPLVVGSNPQLVDGITVFEPFLQYTASQLPHVPLWDPYIMGGTPYLGDMQSAVFSPFSLPAYVLPFWYSLSVIALLKVVVAAMGAFLLGRALSMRTAGAFVCGLVFGFGLFMVAWIPWPLTNVFALIPWLLLATEYLVRRPRVLSAAALAALVALQWFGGHPESSVYALFAVAGYFVLRVVQWPGGGAAAMTAAAAVGGSRLAALARVAVAPLVVLVVAVAVGSALAAVALLPFDELLRGSNDLGARPRAGVHVPPDYVFGAFLPGYFPNGFVIETAFYAGALPLMLAVVGLLRPRVERVVVAVVALLTVAVVLGIQPFFAIAGHIPALDATYLSRLTIVYLLCVALLAGWGLDDLVHHRLRGRRAWAAALAAVGLLLLPLLVVVATHGSSWHVVGRALDIAWRFARAPLPGTPHAAAIDRLASLVVWLTVATAAVVLLSLRLGGRLAPRLFAVLAIALVVGDLFQAGMGYNPVISESHAVQPVTGAIGYLQHQEPARFVGVTPYATANPLPPDVNLRYGLYDLRGYDLPVISRFGDLWQRYVAPPTPLLPLDTPSVPLTVYNGIPAVTMRVLSLFGVRDLLEQRHEPPPGAPGLRLVYRGADASVYQNEAALPRTWLVDRQDVVGGDAPALRRTVSAGFDPRRSVVTEQRLPGLALGPGGGEAAPGAARITSYTPERVAITADARRPAELVLSDTYYPGWQVTVDGHPAAISRVDYLLRGVALPTGADHVVFTYDPASFRHGWMISLAAALVTAAAVAVALLRRRPDRARHARSGRMPRPPAGQPRAPSGHDRPLVPTSGAPPPG